MLTKVLVTSLLVLSSQKEAFESAPFNDDPWDLDGPCQKYVEKFAVYQSQMVACATNWSIPPKVCTNCYMDYINFKTYEFQTKNLDKVFSLDNRTCSQVIYDNYLLSYSSDISTALTSKIWEKSRCDSCVQIAWNLHDNKSTPSFTERTLLFQNRLYEWRNCIVNYTSSEFASDFPRSKSARELLEHLEHEEPENDVVWRILNAENVQNGSKICNQCRAEFDELYKYYWKIYTTPDVDFCVDVETTMNDTIHLWDDVWQCAERQDRNRDLFGIMITFATLMLLTALFYAASYIQGGGQTRNLVRYSRLSDPRGQRSRLLSSGMSDADLVHRTTTLPFNVPIHQTR